MGARKTNQNTQPQPQPQPEFQFQSQSQSQPPNQPSNQPQEYVQLELPKEDTPAPNEAPPEYTPPIRPIVVQHPVLGRVVRMSRDPYSTLLDSNVAIRNETMGLDEGASPISLRINTAITIGHNQNLICLNDSPRAHANAIAHAVIEAFKKNGCGGIPMIDEDGRPRPINIEVEAGMNVEGAGNVVGSEDVINEVLRQRASARKRSHEEAVATRQGESPAESSETASKRQRDSH